MLGLVSGTISSDLSPELYTTTLSPGLYCISRFAINRTTIDRKASEGDGLADGERLADGLKLNDTLDD